MQTTALPRFQAYADVVKAIEAATTKAALEQLSESVNKEYEQGRLDMTANDWGDFAARLVMRDDAIEQSLGMEPAGTVLLDGTTVHATYASTWDGGVEVSTECTVDINSGIVEAEPADVQGLEQCEGELVRLQCGAEFQVVECDGENRIEDVAAFQAAVQANTVQLSSLDPIKAAILVLRKAHPELATAVEQLASRPTGLVPEPNVVHIEESAGGLYAVSCRLHGDDDDSVYHIHCSTEGVAQDIALRQLYAEACCEQDPSSPDYRGHYIISSQLVASPARV